MAVALRCATSLVDSISLNEERKKKKTFFEVTHQALTASIEETTTETEICRYFS